MRPSTPHPRIGTAIVAIVSALLLGLIGSVASAEGSTSYTYTFQISRGELPALSYTDLTYVAQLGAVSNPRATVNGAPATSSAYDPASGSFVFSSDQVGEAVIAFDSAAPPGAITVRKASLKGNKAFAWSHGMDDNVNLQKQIDLIAAKGWRATLFMIGNIVSETRQEPGWIIDQPGLVALLNQGWSIGNHTWSHACYGGASKQEILDGQAVVERVVAASDRPGYVVISFAAPCFDTAYDPIFRSLRNGATTLLVDELGSGSPELMNVDGADLTAGGRTATGVSSADFTIGRDTTIESGAAAANATLDWMAANAGPDRHFWFNTLSHGNQEGNLSKVLNHAYSAYGPAGADTLWMAPEDEIYSYLLVRDQTSLSSGVLAVVGQAPATATSAPATATSVPATATSVPATATSVPPSTSSELLLNGDFELATNGAPSGWTKNAAFEQVSDTVLQGSYSGRLRSVRGKTITINSSVIAVTAGTTYRMSGAVYSRDTINLKPKAIWQDASGKTLRTQTLAAYSGGMAGWASFSKTLTAPAGASRLIIRLPASQLNGTIWLDGFSVTVSP